VPQLVFDAAWAPSPNGQQQQNECNIICTQPRRMAAISVAKRVAQERGQRVGDQVGYTVRVDKMTSRATRLHFCTIGVLLRRLQSDPMLTGVTHVMVDEVSFILLPVVFLSQRYVHCSTAFE
jgi:HrpA-like RNA helicase